MKKIFKKILGGPLFTDMPPVLFDIGASVRPVAEWADIARYSITVAFDPDDRLTTYIERSDRRYRKLIFIPRIVHPSVSGEAEFNLTESPECSSLLPPREEDLKCWHFSNFFRVISRTAIKTVTMPEILQELQLDRIDGYKTDSQGMDLDIFCSVPEKIRNNVLALEMEPGFIDAYREEKKIRHILDYMDNCSGDFLLADCRIKPVWYMPSDLKNRCLSNLQKRLLVTCHTPMPGWAELTFLNRLRRNDHSERQYQLAWIFAMLYKQYGLAMDLADRARRIYPAGIYDEMFSAAVKAVPFWKPVFKKIGSKLLKIMHVK